MNSRERVLTAMNHVRPDRVPINFRSVDTVADRMEHYYSKSHQELLEYLQVDFREVIPPYTGPAFPKDSNGNFFDEWGVRRKEVVTDRSRDVFVDYSPLADVFGRGDHGLARYDLERREGASEKVFLHRA